MVSIQVNGRDVTASLSDWTLYWCNNRNALHLKCHYPSGKFYVQPLSNCSISPTRSLSEMLLIKSGSAIASPTKSVTIYGERYAVVTYPNTTKPYPYKLSEISLMPPTAVKSSSVFSYFSAVAKARSQQAPTKSDRDIADNVVRQLEKLPARADTALQAYCTAKNMQRPESGQLIYPFGLNASQLEAVEQAFNHQISLIEGPPGTGKTQTILNIIANILLRGQTVAVLSNNNSAVENVYEKLEKNGLGHLIAKLGKQNKRNDFFANLPDWPSEETHCTAPALEQIQALVSQLKQLLNDQNRTAQLQAEISELEIERDYLRQWQEQNGIRADLALSRYKLSPSKATDLMAFLNYLGEGRIRFKDRLSLLTQFRVIRARPFSVGQPRQSAFHGLQMHYYDTVLQDKQSELLACQARLKNGSFNVLLQQLSTASMQHLKRQLHRQPPPSGSFDETNYRDQFDAFIKRFPILGSSTHSIVNSLKTGAVLDYVIIDEASQQDIVPGILALACAKNLVIVGDSRQLAHIPTPSGLTAPVAAYDCERYSLLESCIQVFKGTLPKTLLKEHYRCHPRIIQFCNQQFYDNALVPMTEDKGEPALHLIVTAKGNHARQHTNQRELDSLLHVLNEADSPLPRDCPKRGFIAPFRAQVKLSDSCLPTDFIKDTVHKFQGRECDEIVFSTVLDHKQLNQARQRIDFVDDPRMINVAVSRARHRFTLVTGDEVFTRNNGHIAALIRYMSYYAQDEDIVRAPVVSAFDLLYREYDQSLARLNKRLRPQDSDFKSEQITAQLLREALSATPYQAMMFHSQVRLNQLAEVSQPSLTETERTFMKRSSCDFVLYFKVGKTPLGVIEVDGGDHDKPDQIARDRLKNSILNKCGLPILRLRTVKDQVEERIATFISQWAATSAEK